jgi:radical SAM superfamily enzyme YgiQ (UPF0313 family)
MNVLLIYPEFPDTFWSFKHAVKFIRKKSPNPPLGLLTIAAMLPVGWQKRLVDLNIQKLRDDEIAWADLAMVSAMTVQQKSARQVFKRLKKAGITIVAGGPLFTATPEQFPEADHLVLNEAEITLPQFLSDLEKGRPKRIYQTDQYADMTLSPAPLWELADMTHYVAMSIQYSRGCPFHCEFCNVTALLGHKPRTKTVAQILNELGTLERLGWKDGVFFVDDNFIGNKKVLKNELLPALIDWQQKHSPFTFFTEASIDLADDPELVSLMVSADFESVFIGIETPNEESLLESGKHHNRRRNLEEGVRTLQRAGLIVQGGFIVGFDSDPPDIFQRQIDFIQSSGIVTAMVGTLQAMPGTRLYERLQREGRLIGQTTGDNVASSTNILPRMGLERLKAGYREIMTRIYEPKHFYKRLTVFLRDYRKPKFRAKLTFQRKMAFFRALLHLGILGRERFHYWKMVVWTLATRPRLLPTAVTLAIYGHHFRRVCENNGM